MLLKDAIVRYEKHIKVYLSAGTVRYFYGKKNIILRYLGNYECSDINSDVLEDFVIQQRERNPKISNATINKYLKMVRQILKYSSKIKLELEKLPEVTKIPQVVPDSIRIDIYNYYKGNQNKLTDIRNYIIFRLLFETGLRLTELGNLRINDFDFQKRVIHVKKTKTNQERFVCYFEETNDLLKRYILIASLNDYLLINFKTREQLQVYSIEKIVSRIKKKLNIEQSISPHKWRHTFATGFANANGNINVLRELMGHTSLKTTQRYIHMTKEKLLNEYERVYHKG